MKKILALLLSALTAAGMMTTASAWEENTDYVILGQSNSQAYSVSKESYPECTTGQLLTGIVAQCLKSSTENSADKIFDGDRSTYYENTSNSFAYLILDQAYELTEVRCAPTNAEGIKLDTHFGLVIQGSNDGENWVTVIHRAHDPMNYDYRIYTPSLATEQAYMDAGYGKTPYNDGSVWWRGKGGSFRIYRILNATVGEIEFYGNPAEATVLTPEIASKMDFATPYYFPGNIHVMENAKVVSIDGSLTGTVIGAGGAWNGANYDLCFNDNNKRSYDPPIEGPQCWVGLKMDQPYALTEVRVLPKRDSLGRSNMLGAQVQGSIDGVNWRTLAVFSAEDIPDKQEYVIKTVTDTDGYIYFRYVNCFARQSSCSNLLLFGAPAEPAEPFTCEPLIATHNTFESTIVSAAEKNVVTGTEISGTPICGQYYYGWTDRKQGMEAAFDGDIKTEYCTISSWLGPQYWAGLKPDAPTVCKTVRIYRDKIEDTYYFQGSVDGVTWVDLTTFNTKVDTKDAEGWLTKTVDDATEYSYFRLFNSNIDNFDTGMAVSEIKIYSEEYVAPETTAPETAAPETSTSETDVVETAAPETVAPETSTSETDVVETAAPETAAPETAAPETAAPETAAPETTAPETAAPETATPETAAPETAAPETDAPDTTEEPKSMDTGVIVAIAAVAVVAIIAVIVIAKKKK